MVSRPLPTLHSIQALRGVAAMLVVLYHACQTMQPAFDALPHKAGRFGVDLFFVISAFIMIVTTQNRPVSPLQFLWNRFTRIAPLYYLATALAALLALTIPGVLPGIKVTSAHLVQSLLFISHENPANPEAIAPLYRLGWTLNFEMYFYLLLAIGLALMPGRRAFFVSACVIALVVLRNQGLIDWVPLAFLGSNIALEFVFGMALAHLWLSGRLPVLPTLAAWVVGLTGLAVPFVLEAAGVQQPRGLIFGVPAVAITWAALSLERHVSGDRHRVALAIGDASYSLYLSHLFLLGLLALIWPFGPVAFVLAALILCPVFGWLVFAGIERPLLRLFRRPRPAARDVAP